MMIYGLIENICSPDKFVGKHLTHKDKIVGIILGCEVFAKDDKFLKYRAIIVDKQIGHEITINNLKYINNGLTITAKKEDTKNV